MIFIGIDPGKTGSVSVIDGKDLCVIPTPVIEKEYDIAGMYGILVGKNRGAFAVLERGQAMPGQGVVSMFEFGRGYGLWQMALAASGIPYQIVHPRVWTRVILGGSPGKDKSRSFHAARRMFPQWNPQWKKEHQYCDSILLAEYCRRVYTNDKL
jgi:crossover junction endodeoxyribonuclease RuvC